jgi:hypothetical protein
MKTTAYREKDGGPVVNWLAEACSRLALWLFRVTNPYVVTYTIELDEDDKPDEQVGKCSGECGCNSND